MNFFEIFFYSYLVVCGLVFFMLSWNSIAIGCCRLYLRIRNKIRMVILHINLWAIRKLIKMSTLTSDGNKPSFPPSGNEIHEKKIQVLTGYYTGQIGWC